jgi:hypothetical protein
MLADLRKGSTLLQPSIWDLPLAPEFTPANFVLENGAVAP